MDLRLGLIILVLFSVNSVSPAKLPLNKSGNQCALQCTESKNLLYQPGKTYTYKYNGKTQINSADGNGQQLIEVNAKALVSVIDNCELSLELKDVELKGLESPYAAKKELEGFSIGFSYQDGSVESVCPSAEDSTWSVNVKKAIISALQVASTPKSGKTIVKEIDILGHCETQYEAVAIPSSSNVFRSLKKTKNLKNCHHRQASLFSLFPTRYSSESNGIQNLPILANEHSCAIEVSKASIVSRVLCTDLATLLPLSWSKTTSSGFESMLSLTLESTSPSSSVRPVEATRRQSLAYKHTLKETSTRGDMGQVIALLKDICVSIEDEIKSSVPARFSELVYHLRTLSPSETSKLWSAVNKGEICSSTSKVTDLLADALIMDGSEGSLKVIVELINEGSTSPVTINYWLTLLAFTNSPTEGSIKSLLPLIKDKSLPRQSVLGVSSLVHNYCLLPDVDCSSSPIINEVTRNLVSRLAYKCSVTSETEDDIIVSLKGLANIAPYLSNGEVLSILECSKSSNSIHVRVTAIETLRAASCSDSVAPTMMDMFISPENDAELRIAAYKNVISCPSASKIEAILLTLEKESSVQVGSYVVSHLSSIQRSSDPLKSELKLYLTGIKIPLKSFPSDVRKYSRYYELSQHFAKINMGAVVESDVIFDGSYIPRSVKANLSLPLFGSSANIAEIGFRQRGLENQIEDLFGPSGSLKGKSWKEILEYLTSQMVTGDDPTTMETNRYRLARRSAQWPFKPVKLESLIKKATIVQVPVEGSMYLKVDGKTIVYISMSDLKKQSSRAQSSPEHVILTQKVDRAFSFMLMDSIHQFPGINGFPIKIDINSTAVIGYKNTGRTIYPSFAAQMSVKVGFDARTSQPGLKWQTTVNSAPALTVDVKKSDSSVSFSMPKDSLTLFHYKSDLISISADNTEKYLQSEYTRHHDGCTQSFTKSLGIELCGEMSVPKPLFTLSSPFIPFNGPIDFDLSLRKTDLSMEGWTFIFQLPTEDDLDNRVYSIGFLTPKSTVNREYRASLAFLNKRGILSAQKSVQLTMVSPYKKIDGILGCDVGEKSIQMHGNLTIDDKEHYLTLINFDNRMVGRDVVYQGGIFLDMPSILSSPFDIKSMITVKPDSSATFNLKPKKGAAYIDGTIGLSFINVSGDLRFTTFRLSSTVNQEASGLKTHFALSYRKSGASKEEKFSYTSSFKSSTTGTVSKFLTKAEGSATIWPKNSFLVTWESSYAPWELIENDITFESGFKSAKGYSSKSKITQISRFNGLTGDYSDISARNTLLFDVAGIYYKANLISSGRVSSTLPKVKIEFTGGNKWQADKHSLLVDFVAETRPLLRSSTSASIRLGSFSVNFVDSLVEKSHSKFYGNNELMISGNTFWTLGYNYSAEGDSRNKMSRDLDLSVKLPRYNIDFSQDGSFVLNRDEMALITIASNKQSKLWSIDGKLSQTGSSKVRIDLHSLGSMDADVSPFAPNRMGYLKLSYGGHTQVSKFAASPSSIAFESELKSKSSLVYQVSGQMKSSNRWSLSLITTPVTLSLNLSPSNGKVDLQLVKERIHHVSAFNAEQSTLSVSTETRHRSKSLLAAKCDYNRAGSFALEVVTSPVELHSEANFKSANRLEMESTLNVKAYSKVFTMEGAKINDEFKLNLASQGLFAIKCFGQSTESLKINVDIVKKGVTELLINNKPELKAISFNGNYPNSGWEHSTLFQQSPEATTVFFNTQKQSQKYLFINGRLSNDLTALEMKAGEKHSVYVEWSSIKGKGNFKLTSGHLHHDSSLSMGSKKVLFTSKTANRNENWLKASLETDQSNTLDLTLSMFDDHSAGLALKLGSKAHLGELTISSQSYSFDHSTKVNYAFYNDNADLKSVTNLRGSNFFTLKAQSSPRVPLILEVYSAQVTGTFQMESTNGIDGRYSLKMGKPFAIESEVTLKPSSSHYTVYSLVKSVSSGKQLFEIDVKIQPSAQSKADVNMDGMKGRFTYTHWSLIELSLMNGADLSHETSLSWDESTSTAEIKSVTTKSGSVAVRLDGYCNIYERVTLKVVKGPWEGSTELNLDNLAWTLLLNNQARSFSHSTEAAIVGNTFTLSSDTTQSSEKLFVLESNFASTKSEVKVSTPSWSSMGTFTIVKSVYDLRFNLKRPELSSDYDSKVIFDSQSMNLKLLSNSERKSYKSSIESEVTGSGKSWLKYSSTKKGRVDLEVNPSSPVKSVKINISWKPTSFIHNSEVRFDSNGLKVKSTSSKSNDQLYSFNGSVGSINGQPGIEMDLVAGGSSYRHASSFGITKEAFNLQSKSTVDRVTYWDLKVLVPNGAMQSLTTFDLDSPTVSGKANFDASDRSLKIDVFVKPRGQRVTLKTVYGPAIIDSLTFDLAWDVGRDENARLIISREGESTDSSRRDSFYVEYGAQIKAKLTSKLGYDVLAGPHDISMSLNSPNTPDKSISLHHEMTSSKIECALKWFEDRQIVHQLVHEMIMGSGSMTMDIGTKSSYPVLDGLHMSFKHTQSSLLAFSSELKTQIASGSPYSIKLNTESPSTRKERSFVAKLWIKTPIREFKQQGLTINLSWTPDGSQSSANLKVTRESGESASIVANYLFKTSGGSFSLETSGPLTGSYDGSMAKGQFDARSSKKSVSFESEIVTLGAFNFILTEQKSKYDGQFTFSSSSTARYSGTLKTNLASPFGATHELSLTQNNLELFGSKVIVDYGKPLLGSVTITSKGSELVRFELNRYEVSSEETKFIADYTGPKGPFKVNLNLQSASARSSIEMQVCPGKQCYNLQTVGIFGRWGQKYEITYRKGSFVRTYSGSYELKSQPTELTASGLINLNGVSFGGEIFSTESKSYGKIILAQRIVEVRVKSTKSKMVFDLLFDAKRDPSSKSALEIDWIHQVIPSKGLINLNYKVLFGSSSLHRPISVSFLLRKDQNDRLKPFDSRLLIDIGRSAAQSLAIESRLENVAGNSNNRSLSFLVYQPGSSTLFKVTGHYGSVASRSSAGLKWTWTDNSSVQRSGLNLFTVDYANKQVSYIAYGGFNDISGRAQYMIGDKSIDLIGEATINGVTQTGQLTGSVEGNCGLVKAISGDSLKRKVEACFEPYQMINVNSQRYDQDTTALTDLLLTLQQKNGKVLKASLRVDPNYSKQLNSISWPSFNLRKPRWTGLPSSMKVNHQIFIDIYQPISDSVALETIEFLGELDQHTSPLRSALATYAPTFEIPSIDFSPFMEAVHVSMESVRSYIVNSLKSVCKKGSTCHQAIRFCERNGLKGIVSKPLNEAKIMFNKNVDQILSSLNEMAASLRNNFSFYSSRMASSPMVASLRKQMRSLAKLPCRLTKATSTRINSIYNSLTTSMLSNPDIRSLINIFTSIYREISNELKKLEVKSALSSSASQYSYLLSPSVWGASARYTAWQPEKGVYEAEIVSPVDLKTAQNSLQSSQRSLSDLNDSLNGFKASLWSTMTPPFEATAFLLGGQHFVTFDGKSFDLGTTDCSYLLARDFVNGNFSVIVKYQRGNKKSFLVTLGDGNVIEIIPSEKKVKLGKNVVELPVIQGSLSINRYQQSIVLEDPSNRLTFKCFLGRDICSLTISGWYFGRTKGLFGTYDYEPANDYLLPNGRQATEPGELASGWEIEGSCDNPSGAPVRREEIRRSSKAYRLCDRIFSSSESPLADGFSFVPPNFYFEMCLRQMAAVKGQDRPEKALCNVAGSYIELVKANGLELTMPAECLACEAGQEFGSRSVIAPTSRSQRADVVFVIEERPCNTKLVNDLPNLARIMNKELEESDLRETRFGVIGFGGSSSNVRQAHGHTARGELLFQHQDVIMAVKRMEMAPAESYDTNYTDALGAIVLASQYPFRKAASKNVVLLTCKPCDETASRFDYNDIQNLLLSEGITLHVVSHQRFDVKHSTSKTRDILGIDSRSVQRASDIRSTEISDEQLYLRKSITLPKDVCVSLATLSNGSFYPSPIASSLDHRAEKLWSLGLARRLASTATPNQCQHCDCVPENDLLHSKILCRPCRPMKPVY